MSVSFQTLEVNCHVAEAVLVPQEISFARLLRHNTRKQTVRDVSGHIHKIRIKV